MPWYSTIISAVLTMTMPTLSCSNHGASIMARHCSCSGVCATRAAPPSRSSGFPSSASPSASASPAASASFSCASYVSHSTARKRLST